MFHFELVHVPGTHHGPDGLSRRRPQPGDEEEPEDDFDDWVDNVNGFIHMVNPLPKNISTLTDAPPVRDCQGYQKPQGSGVRVQEGRVGDGILYPHETL